MLTGLKEGIYIAKYNESLMCWDIFDGNIKIAVIEPDGQFISFHNNTYCFLNTRMAQLISLMGKISVIKELNKAVGHEIF